MKSTKNSMLKLILVTVLLTIAPGSTTAQDCILYEDYIHWQAEGETENDSSARDVAVYGDYAYMVENGLFVFDVSNPAHPQLVREVEGVSTPNTVAVVGDLACVGDYHLFILDLKNPDQPQVIGFLSMGTDIKDLTFAGDLVFIAGASHLFIADIGRPEHPQLLSAFEVSHSTNGVALAGDIAYVTSDYHLNVLDVSNPRTPELLHTMVLAGCCTERLDVAGDFLFIADGAGLRVVDVSDPTAPFTVTQLNVFETVKDVMISGDVAFLAVARGLAAVDITDPTNPVPISILRVYDDGYWRVNTIYALDLAGDFAYLAADTGGMQIVDISSLEPAPIRGRVGEFTGTDVKVDGDLIQMTGSAPVPDFRGLKVFDAGDPANPVEIGSLVTPVAPRDLTVSGNITHLSVGEEGLYIVDTSDPTTPEVIGVFDTSGEVLAVEVKGDYAVVADHWDVKIVDVSNPADMKTVCWVDTPGVAVDVAIAGNFAFVAMGDQGFMVLDITDPRDAIVAAMVPNAGTPPPIYAHQIFVSDQDHCAYVADTAGLFIYDIHDPYNPWRVGMFDTPGGIQSVEVQGNRAYVAGESGLQVLSLVDRSAPQQLGTAITGIENLGTDDFGLTLANGLVYFACASGLWIYPQECPDPTPVEGQHPRWSPTALGRAIPNPFNPRTRIDFTVDRPQRVTISIFDLAGREVAVLTDRLYRAGGHELDWFGCDGDGRPVASGVYLVNLKAGELTESRKVMLAR